MVRIPERPFARMQRFGQKSKEGIELILGVLGYDRVIIAPGKAGRWVGRSLSAAPVAQPLVAEVAAWQRAVVVAVPVAEVVAAGEPDVPPAEVVAAVRVKPVVAAVPAVAVVAELAALQEAVAAERALLEGAVVPAAAVAAELAAPREAVAAECVLLEAARVLASAAAVPMVLAVAQVAQIASRPVAASVQLAATTEAACVRLEPMEQESRPWHQTAVSVQPEAVAMAEAGPSWSLTSASLRPAHPSRLLVPLEKGGRRQPVAHRPGAAACCCWAAATVDHPLRRAGVVQAACY